MVFSGLGAKKLLNKSVGLMWGPNLINKVKVEVGRAWIFCARVVTFGHFNLKIGPGAIKIWAIIMGLKIYKTLQNKTSNFFSGPLGLKD
jgi:hypothetical protein